MVPFYPRKEPEGGGGRSVGQDVAAEEPDDGSREVFFSSSSP